MEIKQKISEITRKLNPYSEKRDIETNRSLEKKSKLVYNKIGVWLIDVHLNGVVINFILAVYGKQPVHYFFVLANGLIIWILSEIINNMWLAYVKGKKGIR